LWEGVGDMPLATATKRDREARRGEASVPDLVEFIPKYIELPIYAQRDIKIIIMTELHNFIDHEKQLWSLHINFTF
jgi:hypothetical protein